MKLTINRLDLEYALNLITGAVDKKKAQDYAGSVLLRTRTNGNKVELHATDLELFASITLEAITAEVDGDIVLPADKFTAAVKAAGGREIELHDTQQKTNIKGSTAAYEIAGLDPEFYPFGPAESQNMLIDFQAGKLPACIGSVMHAVCTDPTKDKLCGINFALDEKGRLTICATDGHRLSVAGFDLPGECIHDKFKAHTFTLSGKAASMLAKINAGISAGRVAKQCRLYFQSGSISICSAEMSREYPDVRRVIPTGEGNVITADTAALIEVLESCCVMSDDTHRSVTLDITPEAIGVSALGTNNTARGTVPCIGDSEIQLRFNSKYLIQALKSLDSAEVFIKYFGGDKPIILIPADHKSWDERIEVLMQLRS